MCQCFSFLFGLKSELVFLTFSSDDSKVAALVVSVLMAGVKAIDVVAVDSVGWAVGHMARVSGVESLVERVITQGGGFWGRVNDCFIKTVLGALESCVVLSRVVLGARVTIVLSIVGIRERARFREWVWSEGNAIRVWRGLVGLVDWVVGFLSKDVINLAYSVSVPTSASSNSVKANIFAWVSVISKTTRSIPSVGTFRVDWC